MVFIEVFTAVFLAEMCKLLIDRYFKSKFEKQLDKIEVELNKQIELARKNANNRGGDQ